MNSQLLISVNLRRKAISKKKGATKLFNYLSSKVSYWARNGGGGGGGGTFGCYCVRNGGAGGHEKFFSKS